MKIIQKIWRKLGKNMQWFLVWIIHPKINVGVSLIIPNTKGEYLLGKHVFSGEKSWRLIGGYIEKNENIFNGAKREVLEELGIEIEIERLLRVRTGFRYRVEFALVSRTLPSDIVFYIQKKELEEVQWFTLPEIPADTLESHVELLKLHTSQTEKGNLNTVSVVNL